MHRLNTVSSMRKLDEIRGVEAKMLALEAMFKELDIDASARIKQAFTTTSVDRLRIGLRETYIRKIDDADDKIMLFATLQVINYIN